MTRKVILEDNDGEELIPYTNLATSSEAGRIRPDNSTLTVNANGILSVNGVTGAEIGYLSGVTSGIQTQLNGKQPTISNATTTEIGYLSGVTSAIQTQINGLQTQINGKLDSSKIQVVQELPTNPDSNTFYFIVEE